MRKVRSFVIRYRPLTLRQKNALQNIWPEIGVDFTNNLVSLNSLFGNNNMPIILEIGFGMGDSLIKMAKQNKNQNFLGIEVYTPGISACLLAAKEAKLNNIRIICHDAIEVLERMIPNTSLSIVQLFFPDPWHKLKHNKRRIVQRNFAELVLQKLKLGGLFHMVTDFEAYAKHILNVMTTISNYRNLSSIGNYVNRPISRPNTKFEIRGQLLGHHIYELMFERIF